MLSPDLEPREAKAARWGIEVVKQQPSGDRGSELAGWTSGGEKGAREVGSMPEVLWSSLFSSWKTLVIL